MADYNDVLGDDDCPPWLTALQETANGTNELILLHSNGMRVTAEYTNNSGVDRQMTSSEVFLVRHVEVCMRVSRE